MQKTSCEKIEHENGKTVKHKISQTKHIKKLLLKKINIIA